MACDPKSTTMSRPYFLAISPISFFFACISAFMPLSYHVSASKSTHAHMISAFPLFYFLFSFLSLPHQVKLFDLRRRQRAVVDAHVVESAVQWRNTGSSRSTDGEMSCRRVWNYRYSGRSFTNTPFLYMLRFPPLFTHTICVHVPKVRIFPEFKSFGPV